MTQIWSYRFNNYSQIGVIKGYLPQKYLIVYGSTHLLQWILFYIELNTELNWIEYIYFSYTSAFRQELLSEFDIIGLLMTI